jgi:hypothetical protein
MAKREEDDTGTTHGNREEFNVRPKEDRVILAKGDP